MRISSVMHIFLIVTANSTETLWVDVCALVV